MVSARFEELAGAVSNWGRWGDDDERGTLNLLDEAARQRAVAAVDSGRPVPLSLPFDQDVPRTLGNPRRTNPVLTLLAHDQTYLDDGDDSAWSEDLVTTALQAGTHWDALAHVSWRQQIYNGFGVETITTGDRATRCGIDKVGPLVGRGVLLDVAHAAGVEHLENGTRIEPAHLDAALAEAGTDLEPGDVALVRTGAMGRWLAGSGAEKKAYVSASPGFGLASARWFHDRAVAALATDSQNPDVFPSEEDGMLMPFGVLALRQMGMMLGQNWVLEDLAATCRTAGRLTFMVEASPLPITGGLGSPVQPVAIL